MDIREALSQLDSMNDDHWTGDNVPRLDVLSELVGRKVTRKEVFDAAPKFSRTSMEIPTEPTADSGAEGGGEPETGSFATMPMKEFMSLLVELAPEGLVSLRESIDEAALELDRQEAALKQARVNLKIMKVQTTRRLNNIAPDFTTQQAIQHHLQTQHELRAAKVAATRELLKGLKPSDLDPRAMIDRAMARKNQRGTQRPNFGKV